VAHNNDWLPTSRENKLTMARSWVAAIKGVTGRRWGMPEELVMDFEKTVSHADDEFFRPKKERTVGTNALLKDAFVKLTAKMRNMKKRYFFVPPLTEADLAVLGLHPHDNTPTPVGKPVGKFEAKISYTSSGALQVNIIPDADSASHPKSNFGYRIYYGVYAHGDTPPTTGKDLRNIKFSHHKRLTFTFEPEDKAKTAYFCIRAENGKGDEGEWGDLSSAIIP
jgi:hypothetical protein